MEAPHFRVLLCHMTIHTRVRTSAAPELSTIRAAVQEATTRGGLFRLLELLGHEISPLELQVPEIWTGLPGRKGASRAIVAASHGTLLVVLIEAVFGATPSLLSLLARNLRNVQPLRPMLMILASPEYSSLTFACYATGDELRHATFSPSAPCAADIEILRDMVAAAEETGIALSLRYANALDRTAITARFFAEVRTQRTTVSAAWKGLPPAATADRDQLALLLLCRLMFLYFIQQQGHLAGDVRYMIGHVRDWQRSRTEQGLYESLLVPLFFGSLNTRPERRDARARSLGPLPYLNGGLFERHAVERRYPDLSLPDAVLTALFDRLLERFRFTVTDSADAAAFAVHGTHIDPEMLGRVFEGLMSADRRGQTGTFYTPPATVDRLTVLALEAHLSASIPADAAARLVRCGDVHALSTRECRAALGALTGIRILDPACGSGAFLLGAMSRLAGCLTALGRDPLSARREVVAECLHGVDLLDDAALLCSLRLWLALVETPSPATPEPLPNLDRRIRQGDALLDPVDLSIPGEGADLYARARRGSRVRSQVKRLGPMSLRYLDAEPDERPLLRSAIERLETEIAGTWLGEVGVQLTRALKDAQARGLSVDLWGERTPGARQADTECRRLEKRLAEVEALLQQITDSVALPFFSFRVHFADRPAFDMVLSNPPWIRSHNWPSASATALRERYTVCRNSSWSAATAATGSQTGGQVDLALLFLERSLSLLRAGGTLGMLLPAKTLRSLYAAGARRMLLTDARPLIIDDHSLDQRSVFRADAFTTAIVARKGADPEDEPRVQVRMIRRGVPPLEFCVDADELPLIQGDRDAPWLIAPTDATTAFRRMQAGGPMIGSIASFRVRRGVVTGANDVLIARECRDKLGDLTHIRAEGYFHARKLSHSTREARRFVAYVETAALRPLVRGSDVRAWRCNPTARLICSSADGQGRRRGLPPRTTAYLKRHASTLSQRTAYEGVRVSADSLGHKVVWQDIADTLNAVAMPAVQRDRYSAVPLNTVYFIAVPDETTAYLLAAYMNSLPVRTLARAAAERAKDARFRFFAWTVATLPLPSRWTACHVDALIAMSRQAHEQGGLNAVQQARLDALVADCYGLSDSDMTALLSFDAWLAGRA